MAGPAIELRGVTKRFATPKGGIYTALTDLTMEVAPGEFCAVVGPTGCGKSTTLALISGLERPSAGEVAVMGKPVNGIPDGIGYVFQTDAVFPWKSVLENVAAGPRYHGTAGGGGPRSCEGVDLTRGAGGVRGSLPISALRWDAQARGTRAELDQRPADPAHGRAVFRPRRADAHADGERAARPLVVDVRVRGVRHPRPRGGDRPCRSGGPSDRRTRDGQGHLRGRPAEAAPRRRNPIPAAVRANLRGHLEPVT